MAEPTGAKKIRQTSWAGRRTAPARL